MPTNWDLQVPPKNPKYSSVVLGYIDILGFSNALLQNQGRFPKRLFNIITELYETLNSSRSGYLQTRFISDSFLVWGEAHEITFGFVLEICGRIETIALKNGFLVRGAISCGRHYIDRFKIVNLKEGKASDSDEIILSPALIMAVKTEKLTWRPGIRIHKSVHKYIKFQRRPSRRKDPINLGPFYFLDLMTIAASPNDSPLPRSDISAAKRDLKKFQRSITNGLLTRDKKALRKWRVMASQYNQVLKRLGQRLDLKKNELIIKI